MSAGAPYVVIVPARLGSTRFPEKVLAARTGKPLVQHVVDRAAAARGARLVAVATDHPRVAEALRPFGTTVVLTGEHPNGTSRLCEAAGLLGLGAQEIVVNAQGDEPDMPPAVLEAAVAALGPGVHVGTVATPLSPTEDVRDPNIVKVVRALDGGAVYFSRAPIPLDRDGAGPAAPARPLRHVGVYAYTRAFLERYSALPATPLERTEVLEQLRVIEHGFRIGVGVVPDAGGGGIDTPEQYEAFVRRFNGR
ncbi:MAG: 3-deoxy-manno-octulosonate cytidylyltransferase [Phycisphaeraceae bacterium]|nr:3-deoxy-manno-octulosonate cytidylyltransferase [Phycisphaeraceae bacterium]